MARTDPFTRQLDRGTLDGQLAGLSSAQRKNAFRRPRRGWVRAVREALGMNGRQLAERLGIARSHLAHIERGELEGGLTLRTMERAAEALGCDFVYAIVPRERRTLERMIEERAREVATKLVRRVDTSMALEAQGVKDSAVQRKEIERIASDLVRARNRGLWDL